MVLGHNLLYGRVDMTFIAIQNDKVVLRDGKVGTGAECCCCPCELRSFFQEARPAVVQWYADQFAAAGWSVTNSESGTRMDAVCQCVNQLPASFAGVPPDPENWYGVAWVNPATTNLTLPPEYAALEIGFYHELWCNGILVDYSPQGDYQQHLGLNAQGKAHGINYIRRCVPATSCVGTSCDGDSECEPDCDCLNDLPLSFTSCIGSGAAGTATFENGEITSTAITNGGSGYARLGRVQPTVTASVSGGTGASLSVNLEQVTPSDSCQPIYWKVSSVSVTNGGSGYSDATSLTFSVASGDTAQSQAVAKGFIGIVEPRSWTTGFTPAAGTPLTGRSGAVLTPSWAVKSNPTNQPNRPGQVCGLPLRTAYEVSSIAIDNGGTGYYVGDKVLYTFANSNNGVVANALNATVSTVSGTGAITAITLTSGGEYGGAFDDNGAISEVVIQTCAPASVGNYYRESSSATPYVASVTVGVYGNAVLAAVVGSDASNSSTFGKITSVTITDGGSGYLGICENPLP